MPKKTKPRRRAAARPMATRTQQPLALFGSSTGGAGHLLLLAPTGKGACVRVPEEDAKAAYRSGGTMIYSERGQALLGQAGH